MVWGTLLYQPRSCWEWNPWLDIEHLMNEFRTLELFALGTIFWSQVYEDLTELTKIHLASLVHSVEQRYHVPSPGLEGSHGWKSLCSQYGFQISRRMLADNFYEHFSASLTRS